jgi:hypothetical protein
MRLGLAFDNPTRSLVTNFDGHSGQDNQEISLQPPRFESNEKHYQIRRVGPRR